MDEIQLEVLQKQINQLFKKVVKLSNRVRELEEQQEPQDDYGPTMGDRPDW